MYNLLIVKIDKNNSSFKHDKNNVRTVVLDVHNKPNYGQKAG